MGSLGDIIGDICKVVLPIKEDFFMGNPNSSVAVCTLGSISLLKDLKNSEIIYDVSIIGRLFSENKGIDSIVHYVNQNKNIKKIILCGKEVWGHKAGHSLIKLHKNGIDDSNRIVGSISPEPFLTVTKPEIEYFQTIELIDLIGETNVQKILVNI